MRLNRQVSLSVRAYKLQPRYGVWCDGMRYVRAGVVVWLIEIMSRNFVPAPQTGTADSRTGTLHTHARHTRPHLYHLQLRTPVPSSSTSLRAGASLPNNPPDTTSASPSLISTSILHPCRSSAHSLAQPSSFVLLPPSPLLPHTFMSASRSPDAHGCLSACLQ